MKSLLAAFVVGALGWSVGGGRGNGTLGTDAIINPYQLSGANGVRLLADNEFEIRSQTPDGIVHLLTMTSARPFGVAGDAGGNVYYTTLDAKVWARSAIGALVQLNSTGILAPIGLAVVDNFLYVADKRQAGNEGRVWRWPLPPIGAPELVLDNGIVRNPQLLAAGPASSLYIADTTGGRIVRMNADHSITVIAGGNGTGFSGDGGPATAAQLNFPQGVAVAPDGTVFIMDTGNKRVRQVAGGIITTIAGNGSNSTGAFPAPGINPLAFAIVPLGAWYDSTTATLYIGDSVAKLVLSMTFTAPPPTATALSTSTATIVVATSTPTRTATSAPTCVPQCV